MENNDTLEENNENFQPNDELKYYTDLVDKAEELKSGTDWSLGSNEFENIRLKWGEGPALEDDETKKELYAKILAAQQEFNQAKKAYYEKLNDRKQANLERREEYIKKLSDIVERKKWSAFGEVSTLQRKFEETRPLPADTESQNQRFQDLLAVFEEGKVKYVVESRQKEEENLMIKLMILDKLQQVKSRATEETKDWQVLDKEIEDLSQQWRKVGRVVKEKSDEIWEKFKQTRDEYTALKYEHNKEFRSVLEKNLKTKLALCEKAEALIEEKDLAVASKEINILYKRWKEVGPVSREDSDAIWERFKKAYDAISEIRNANLDTIREIENENLKLKEALCEKVENLADSDENQKDLVEALFNEWNALGPVPKRKTRKVWLRFKSAIDKILEKRRNHFKQLRSEQKDNLNLKREIITKITELAKAEDKEVALAEVKSLQDEFQKIGFVPIKLKNKIWDEYRAACDEFYKVYRQQSVNTRPAHRSTSHDSSEAGGARAELRNKQNELFRLRKECEKLNDTILQYADTKTYIKPNKKGMALIDELQSKIDAAKEELNKKSAELERLRQEIEEIGG